MYDKLYGTKNISRLARRRFSSIFALVRGQMHRRVLATMLVVVIRRVFDSKVAGVLRGALHLLVQWWLRRQG